MKATRMTSAESGVKLRSSRADREYLFNDMPEPTKPKAVNHLRLMREFVAVGDEVGGLIRPVDAAKVLKLAYGTISSYMQQAKPPFEVFEFFGVKWISGRSIEDRLLKCPPRGRPRVNS